MEMEWDAGSIDVDLCLAEGSFHVEQSGCQDCWAACFLFSTKSSIMRFEGSESSVN
jgi:uncharacterized membrane protein